MCLHLNVYGRMGDLETPVPQISSCIHYDTKKNFLPLLKSYLIDLVKFTRFYFSPQLALL